MTCAVKAFIAVRFGSVFDQSRVSSNGERQLILTLSFRVCLVDLYLLESFMEFCRQLTLYRLYVLLSEVAVNPAAAVWDLAWFLGYAHCRFKLPSGALARSP